MSILRDAALEYIGRGWSVIPIGRGKRPAVASWAPFQQTRPTAAQVESWFQGAGKGIVGVGIVCGAVSGGLVARDFDVEAAYLAWAAAFPELAKRLPTVKTARGYHVYCRAEVQPERSVIGDGEGELRREGQYLVAPPSLHPDGGRYAWTVPPSPGEVEVIADLRAAGLTRRWARADPDRESQKPSLCISVSPLPLSVPLCQRTEAAVAATVPGGPGERELCLFNLARRLKAVDSCANVTAKQLEPVLREWHDRARPVIKTKAFEETRAAFARAWKAAEQPWGGFMDNVYEKAKTLPDTAAEAAYEDSAVRMLSKVCRQLCIEAGGDEFFLSCREAARLVGIDRTRASEWLRLLVDDGVLVEVQKGGQANTARRATRFRLGDAASVGLGP